MRPPLAALAVGALLGVAGLTTLAPATFSRLFGLPIDDADRSARGFVRALGARDAALGIGLAVSLARGDRPAARTILGVSSLVAVADFAVAAGGPKPDGIAPIAFVGASTFMLLALAATTS